ncbi:MAG: hypothetical protein IJC56_03535 [Clostridia bacterium]|nr:hypothetical protein [Clostridia bacterium]
MKKILAFLAAVIMLTTASLAEQSYGPGHENHEYACWDNGDGTHSVACDCGVEKRVENHIDADSDSKCDGCGIGITPVEEKLDYEALKPEGWTLISSKEGGVAFAVPNDMMVWDLNADEVEAGIIMICSNEDITVQLRAYEPDDITYDEFIQMLDENQYEITSVRNIEGTEITTYYNPVADTDMQLCGVILNGNDGRLYKISVFGGDNDEFGEDAPVWELAETLFGTVHVIEDAGWDIYRDRTF